MSTTIYGSHSESIKTRKRFAYAYSDDPTFIDFQTRVEHIFKRNEETIPLSVLYTLWYETKSVQKLWSEQYGAAAARRLIFIFHMANVRTPRKAYKRTMLLMVAWYQRCHPFTDPEHVAEWLTKVFDPTIVAMEAEFDKRVLDRNKKRRGITTMKRGRPVQTNGLRAQIIQHLQGHQNTTRALLAQILNVSSRTIESTLKRMKKDGQITNPIKGVYTLAPSQGEGLKQIENPQPALIVMEEPADRAA